MKSAITGATAYIGGSRLPSRLYWYASHPFHLFIFGNMPPRIVTAAEGDERGVPNNANSGIPVA
jgi:hypothetical protein